MANSWRKLRPAGRSSWRREREKLDWSCTNEQEIAHLGREEARPGKRADFLETNRQILILNHAELHSANSHETRDVNGIRMLQHPLALRRDQVERA